MAEYKKCNNCGIEKKETKDNFRWRNDNNCFRNECKICFEEYQKQYRQGHEKEIKEYKKEYYQENKDEMLNDMSKYYKNHKEEISDYNKQYYQENKEELKENNKQYYQEHKEERNEYQKNRKKNDLIYKLHCDMSSAINNNLKYNNSTKNNKSINELLPYNMKDLIEHLENHAEIKDWMKDENGNLDWSKRGRYNPKTHKDNPTWQIDHKTPKSKFNIKKEGDEEFQKCWGLDNLRPYCAKKNIKEGNRR